MGHLTAASTSGVVELALNSIGEHHQSYVAASVEDVVPKKPLLQPAAE
jgi:hypothetical protein